MQADPIGAERWQTIKALVQEALDLEADDRPAFLARSTGDDAVLRAEVESLIHSCEQADTFLERPLSFQDDSQIGTSASELKADTWFGPYKIIECLGSGGMGVVYRAWDPKLDRSVALKFLSSKLSADEKARERLYREARATSALNHPNIRTIYDICEYDSQTCMVMEFLEGTTLNDRRDRVLPVNQLLNVAIQICSALQAAHAKGIVHRDIKPANVLVDIAGTVKVLDFGIAKMLRREIGQEDEHGAERLQSLTQPAVALGTISYMSPEQARGEELDGRTDLFSLGTLLYELATGAQPFAGSTNAIVFDRILNKNPQPASLIRPDLPPQLDAILETLLQKDRTRRYADAEAALAELIALRSAIESQTITGGRTPPRANKRRGLALAAVALIVLGASSAPLLLRNRLSFRLSGSATVATPDDSVTARRTVAVLGFRDLKKASNTAWLSTAISEMLAAQLGAGQSLRIVSGEDVARTKHDLSLAEAESYSPATLKRIHQNLGADYIVLGSYIGSEQGAGEVRLNMQLQDAKRGETIASISENGRQDALFDTVSRGATALLTRLGATSASVTELEGVKASTATTPEVAKLYSEGLDKLRVFDTLQARDLLEQATKLDPKFPPVHAALSEVWSDLGYDAKARAEAKRAFDASGSLLREGRLWVEGQYRVTTRETARAIEVYKMLAATAPDDIGYGLRLSGVQVRAGKTDDAYKSIANLRKLPPPYRDDPRIDLAEAEVAAKEYNTARQLKLAETAEKKAAATGARLLRSQALLRKADALEIQGHRPEALSSAIEARRIFNSVGDVRGAARSTSAIAAVLLNQGDMIDAQETYRDAYSLYKKIGDQVGAARALTNAAIAQDQLGDVAGAFRSYQEALAIRKSIGDISGTSQTLANLAYNLYLQGNLREARKALDEGVAAAQSVAYKRILAVDYNTIGEVEKSLGHLAEAERFDRQALELATAIGDKKERASALIDLALVVAARGEFKEAQRMLEESRSTWTALKDPVMTAVVQVKQADLKLGEGSSLPEEATLQRAKQLFIEKKLPAYQVETSIVLAKYFLAAGEKEKAAAESLLLRNTYPQAKNFSTQLDARLVLAHIAASQQQANDARTMLKNVSIDARRHMFLGQQLEADLALGRLLLANKNAVQGRQLLSSVRTSATATGHHLIARNAQAGP